MKLAPGLAWVSLLLLIVGGPTAAVVLLSAGAGSDQPFSTSATPLIARGTPRVVTDDRQARLVTTVAPGPDILAGPTHGTVTRVGVTPGSALADGLKLFQVDGVDRIGFASSVPFYRSISPGVQGEDVAELHRLLVLTGALNQLPTEPQVAAVSTGQAIAELAASIGAARTTTFDPAWVVFIPEADLVAESVELRAGQPAPPQGTVIITTPGRVVSARLVPADQSPITFEAGVDYIAVVDKEELSIDTGTLSIAEKDLPRLRPSPDAVRDGIAVLTRRRTPLQTLAVPSSAVMTNERGTLCLWLSEAEAYRAAEITVAGARGGVTNVATGLQASQELLVNPSQVLGDPQCP